MAREQKSEDGVLVPIPHDIVEWLDERSDAVGIPREELLLHLVAAYRLTAEEHEDNGALQTALLAGIEDGAFDEIIATHTSSEIRAVENDFSDLIEDVRERVIQVKRETDTKASADHDHDFLANRITHLEETTDELQTTVGNVVAQTNRLEATLDDGFENYEVVLSNVVDTMNEVEERVTKLAKILFDVRANVGRINREVDQYERLRNLATVANTQGIRAAKCESCDSKVDIALLRTPSCPHCEETLSGLEPKRGLFGSNTLQTGPLPALEPGKTDDRGTKHRDDEGRRTTPSSDTPTRNRTEGKNR